jgi:hypothetical protein
MGSGRRLNSSTVARYQRVTFTHDVDNVAVEKNASMLHETSESRL